MAIYYKKWKKYNEIQLTKNKMDLKYSKNDKSSTMHECFPKHHAWKQQELNKIKKQTKKEREEALVQKKVKWALKKRSPQCLALPNQIKITTNIIWKNFESYSILFFSPIKGIRAPAKFFFYYCANGKLC